MSDSTVTTKPARSPNRDPSAMRGELQSLVDRLEAIEQDLKAPAGDYYKLLCLGTLVRGRRCGAAILASLDSFALEALSNARTILELYATLKWVSEDSAFRAPLYVRECTRDAQKWAEKFPGEEDASATEVLADLARTFNETTAAVGRLVSRGSGRTTDIPGLTERVRMIDPVKGESSNERLAYKYLSWESHGTFSSFDSVLESVGGAWRATVPTTNIALPTAIARAHLIEIAEIALAELAPHRKLELSMREGESVSEFLERVLNGRVS